MNRFARISRDNALRALTLVALLVTWELSARALSPVILASPGATIAALALMTSSGALPMAWAESLLVLVPGVVLAASTGIVLGLLLGRNTVPDRLFEPVLTTLFMAPRVALIPVIALWLGYQDAAKIVVVFLFSFFEVFFTVRDGVRAIDTEYIEICRSHLITGRVRLLAVLLPATTPYVITGLRLGLLHGMVGVVLAGYFLEANGIGGLIFDAAGSFRTAQLFGALISLATIGVSISVSLGALERRLEPWRGRERR